MPDLFLTAPSLSPRATWLARHDLAVRDYQDSHGGWKLHSLNTDRFLCHNRAHTRYASGATPDAAEQAYCERYDVDWWKLAEWNEAMESRVLEEIEA